MDKRVALAFVQSVRGLECSSSICQWQHATQSKWSTTYRLSSPKAETVWIWFFCVVNSEARLGFLGPVGLQFMRLCDWVKTVQLCPAVGSMCPLSGDVLVCESRIRGCVTPSLFWKSGCKDLVPKYCPHWLLTLYIVQLEKMQELLTEHVLICLCASVRCVTCIVWFSSFH